MAEIHLLDAHRKATHVARLNSQAVKLATDKTGLITCNNDHSSIHKADLRKKADALHYLLLRLQLEIVGLEANDGVVLSEKQTILNSTRRFMFTVENLIRSIHSFVGRQSSQNS